MRNRSLNNWNPTRFRLLMGGFFLALAVPTALLVSQAYSQLKWEAFYQQRLLAEELVDRIDREMIKYIVRENKRPSSDFYFAKVYAGAPNILQRSPLADFPVQDAIPGTLGHFQVDHLGQFRTPLLPHPMPREDVAERYGINSVELLARQRSADEIYRLLAENSLVAERTPKREDQDHEDLAPPSSQISPSTSDALESAGITARPDEIDGVVSQPSDEGELLEGFSSPDQARQTNSKHKLPTHVQESEAGQRLQANFDKLRRTPGLDKGLDKNLAPEANQSKQVLGRIKDLQLEQRYRKKLEEKTSAKDAVAKSTYQARGSSKKTDYSPRKELYLAPGEEDAYRDKDQGFYDNDAIVSIFNSEVDLYQAGILASGHIVLYRNIKRSGQRVVQGSIIDTASFIEASISEHYRKTSLAATSDLTVGFNGNIQTLLSASDTGNYLTNPESLSGALLLRNKLSSPLDSIELIFSVRTLPAGAGTYLINWLAMALALIIAGGLYLIYRLGLGQMHLAQQQQDFVAAVSHELKTPLTSIRMYGEILKEGWAPADKQREYYEYIHDESDRLSRLINNVLQLANLTRNELPLQLKKCGAAQLLDMIESKISGRINQAGFTLNISVDKHTADEKLMIDTDYFQQIMINLIDNAIKFSQDSDRKQIDISCQKTGNERLQFSVRDYGSGIPAPQMRKIFQLFYRSENESTRETAGTGIGLTLVRQLALAMNGEVDVVTAQPGAEFGVSFPLPA